MSATVKDYTALGTNRDKSRAKRKAEPGDQSVYILPKKKFFRQRAHANVLADHGVV